MLHLATKFAPQATLFEQALHAGFHAAELWLSEKFLTDVPAIVRLARHYPLRLAAHAPNRINEPAVTLPALVRLVRELALPAVVIHQDVYDAHAAGLYALEPNLPLAVENGELPADEFWRWAEVNPALTLDVEHVWKFTLLDAPFDRFLETLRTFLGRYATKVRHVHMPGYWAGMDMHRPMYASREMVFPVLELFQEIGFTGLIISEAGLSYQTPNDRRMDVLLFEIWRSKYERVPGERGASAP